MYFFCSGSALFYQNRKLCSVLEASISGLKNLSVKGKKVNHLVLVDHVVSITTTQLSCCSVPVFPLNWIYKDGGGADLVHGPIVC